ncbi:MAG: type II toxin-antitoxin system HicA family toxin [Desulfobacterales bacterium]|nr:type II toxin-antitoxin system HicA family toxin [Desulfobacterales bacterium]
MNKKQQKTLKKIFAKPTRADIAWNEVKSLLAACNADVSEGRGSRIRIVLNKQVLNLHTPHPQKELKKYAVELVREFLTNTGVKP